ncbi:hypothetical protein [Streptomyces hiroshimensis]|uniref:Uncharacterized protein n=1 Tax=Streptomyces hiroshimensis TaxID=66424 RepID=A0ABQ2Y6P3_9ACTN|nr:hypothetical protein [Streptomyces hiroshimensis]GGX70371.1 hypothetical protein GCM10010324_14270 [Streptomyces hiroshimensis]
MYDTQPTPPPPPQIPQAPQGQWPPPIPPHPGSGKRKAIGIAAGALVFAGALVGSLLYLNSGGNGTAAYRIELPETLMDGDYKKDPADPEDDEDLSFSAKDRAEMKETGIEDADGDAAGYRNAKGKQLQVVGVYGTIPDPGKTVGKMIADMDKKDADGKAPLGGDLESEPFRAYHPRGFDGAVLKCKSEKVSYSFTGMKKTSARSLCIWGDKGAIGLVMSHSMGDVDSDKSEGLSAEELAEATARIRDEVRRPK